MHAKRGGVKQKNPTKKGFLPILDMINKPTSIVHLLTYDSLSGFIFTLTVDLNDEEYLGLNFRSKRFTEPVLSYILKFAAITPKDAEDMPPYNGRMKSTESPDTFYAEAKIQQNAWTRSVTGGKQAICPPVANFSLFTNDNSKHLLDILVRKTGVNPSSQEHSIFRYLQQVMHNNIVADDGTPIVCELGVIVMPTVNNANTIGSYISIPTIPPAIKNQAMVQMAAKAMRLFVDCGIIHFDLHPNNALIYTVSGVIQTLIIDFGRASDIHDLKDDNFLMRDEKIELKKKQTEYYEDVLSLEYNGQPWTPANKVKYVKKVMDKLTYIDKEVNHALYAAHFSKPENKDKYQMYWYENLKKYNTLLEETFDTLKSSIQSLGTNLLLTTIESYVKKDYVLGLNKPVNSYYSVVSTRTSSTSRPMNVNNMSVLSHYDENDCGEPSCVIAGLRGSMKRRMTMKNKTKKRVHRRGRASKVVAD